MSRMPFIAPTNFRPPKRTLVLRLDALYYRSAVEHHQLLKKDRKEIEKHRVKYKRLRDKEKKIISNHGGDIYAAYDDLEPVYIQMEDVDYQIAEAYAPFLRNISHVHIFSAASLECHINARAKKELSRYQFDEFDKLSLTGKWLFFPKIAGLEQYNPGKQPFQYLVKLVKTRNNLMHYKERSEDWSGMFVPSFLSKLGFTQRDASSSLKATEKMISSLSIKMKEETPLWLKLDLPEHFEFRIEGDDDDA